MWKDTWIISCCMQMRNHYIVHLKLTKQLLLSHPAVSNSLQPRGLQHSRPPCPSPSPEICRVHIHCIGDAIQPSHPLTPSSPLPSIFPSIRDFSNGPTVLELQLQHQSFQHVFRVDFPKDWLVWFPCCPRDLQESSQYHSLKASILWHFAFFIVQLSQPYLTTGKIIALPLSAWLLTIHNSIHWLYFN